MDAGKVVFRRTPLFAVGFALVGMLWFVNAVLNLLWFADFGTFALNFVLALTWVALGLLFLRPYVTVSSSHLVVNVAPARPNRSIPWSSIRSITRPRANKLILELSDGKPLKLYLNYLTKADRQALEALLGHYLSSSAA